MDDELITERRSVAFPQVFGYVRHVTGGLARHAALVGCLAEYWRQHELTLGGVFIDRDPAVAVHSPAFVGLLDALELPDSCGAVVPALSHLGPKPVVTERKRQITATRARLIVVRTVGPTRLTASSTVSTRGCVMSVREALRSAPVVNDAPGLRLLRIGEGWDLVRTTAEIGLLALAHLRVTGAAIGPVLYDGPNERLYYAISTGTAESWNDLPVRHLSSKSWLVAPGLELIDDWFGGWYELPYDDTLTDAGALHAALQHPYVNAALEGATR